MDQHTSIATLLLLGVATFAQGACANEWQLESPTDEATYPRAEVGSAEGDFLRVAQDRFQTITMSLRLRPGFERVDTTVCPTLEVLSADGHALPAESTEACQVDAGGARFRLGQIVDQTIRSRVLSALMHGHSITFRMRLTDAGYREAHFSLNGSSQTLLQVLGEDVRVERTRR